MTLVRVSSQHSHNQNCSLPQSPLSWWFLHWDHHQPFYPQRQDPPHDLLAQDGRPSIYTLPIWIGVQLPVFIPPYLAGGPCPSPPEMAALKLIDPYPNHFFPPSQVGLALPPALR
eukprot:6607239-Karenia_brevis.AAC.1